MADKPKAVPVVDIDEATAPESAKQDAAANGTTFIFNEVQLLKFKDGTSYHVSKNKATITDSKMVANLIEASKNPINKIFIQ